MKVKIYDQYKSIYSDNENNGQLVTLSLPVGVGIDTDRYSLIHLGVGTTETLGDFNNLNDALNCVNENYELSKTLGSSYEDKLILEYKGYKELVIYFSNGKILNRVIFIEEENK